MKRIHVIINPASGQPKSILHILNKAFSGADVRWDLSITKASGDAARFARRAVEQGAEMVRDLNTNGCNVIGFGEMGIGNTSAAALIMSRICGLPLLRCVGRGTGLDDAGVARKLKILETASSNHPAELSPMEVLEHFGGFEIAMICGGMMQAAALNMVVLVDGFIATSAVLVAAALHEHFLDYCIFTHLSGETGHGRMLQHLNMGYVNFDSVEHLILDEADRMLDMGFLDDIMAITKHIPEKRQTLMFSATMPSKIRELAKKTLTNPSEVNIAISKPAEGILQAAYMVYDAQKVPLLNSLLREKDLPSILVFSSRKQKVKEIVQSLKRNGFNAKAIHSDLEQAEREDVLREFKNRKTQILVATDIIARGIDIEKIDLVINYDVPRDAEDYVHRVGRTARASTQGVALTLINEEDQLDFYKIERLIEKDIYKIPLPPEIGEGPEYRAPEMFKSRKGRSFNGGKRRNFKNKKKGFKK